MDMAMFRKKMSLSTKSSGHLFPPKNKTLNYRVLRSQRRSFALQVKPGGELIIRVPAHCSNSDIQRILDKHQNWIKINVHAAKENPPAQFVEGEQYLYFGKPYPLLFGDSGSHSIKFDQAFIVAKELHFKAETLILRWFQREAEKYLNHRCRDLAVQFNFSFTHLRLSNAKTNWGSCSNKGSINLNWRLLHCPPEVIDYIIIHELAHLREMNHSPRFWALVKTMSPDYQNHKKWLRRNAAKIRIF